MEHQIKVVHICTRIEGGAGLCASRIIRATRKNGVNARVLVANGKKSDIIDVVGVSYPWSRSWIIRKFQVIMSFMGRWPKSIRVLRNIENLKHKYPFKGVFTSPITLYTEIVNHPWVKEADIIHLHWVGDFLDYPSFFVKIGKPVIWRIPDENPGFGGFHYKTWKEQAPQEIRHLDDELMDVKEIAYNSANNVTLVAISDTMCHFFQNNRLLSKFPYVKIHNGIESDSFTLLDKVECRHVLSIPIDAKVFLFVADSIDDNIKGLDKLISALEKLRIPELLLICMGNYTTIPNASYTIRCEGFVKNNRIQSIYYSAADYFVMSSIQESFGQTSLEAMVCGTPVVGYPVGIVPELINDQNGVVCKDFTVESLAEGIKTAMKRKYDRERIRKEVIERFSYNRIAKQYVDLYESVVKK